MQSSEFVLIIIIFSLGLAHWINHRWHKICCELIQDKYERNIELIDKLYQEKKDLIDKYEGAISRLQSKDEESIDDLVQTESTNP